MLPSCSVSYVHMSAGKNPKSERSPILMGGSDWCMWRVSCLFPHIKLQPLWQRRRTRVVGFGGGAPPRTNSLCVSFSENPEFADALPFLLRDDMRKTRPRSSCDVVDWRAGPFERSDWLKKIGTIWSGETHHTHHIENHHTFSLTHVALFLLSFSHHHFSCRKHQQTKQRTQFFALLSPWKTQTVYSAF